MALNSLFESRTSYGLISVAGRACPTVEGELATISSTLLVSRRQIAAITVSGTLSAELEATGAQI